MSKTHILDIRPAQPTDAGSAADIMTRCNLAFDWMPRLHSAAQDIGFVGGMIDRGWVTVATKGHYGPVIGFIARENDFVHSVYVHPDWQRQGIGTALLEHAKQTSAKLTLWTFEANEGAQTFYCREDFVEAERTDGAGNDENLPDIRYIWPKPTPKPVPQDEGTSDATTAPETPAKPETPSVAPEAPPAPAAKPAQDDTP